MYVLDINGDGRPDILTSMAHDYGICWFKNTADGKWTQHVIDNSWSQAHASLLVDINGDGHLDFVTGKRYMAHNGNDPGEREPLGVYWYEYRKAQNGSLEWSGISFRTAVVWAGECRSRLLILMGMETWM